MLEKSTPLELLPEGEGHMKNDSSNENTCGANNYPNQMKDIWWVCESWAEPEREPPVDRLSTYLDHQ